MTPITITVREYTDIKNRLERSGICCTELVAQFKTPGGGGEDDQDADWTADVGANDIEL